MTDTKTTDTKAKATTKKFEAIRKFGYSGGMADVGDVVELTAKEAKDLNKVKAIAPYFEEEDDE